MPVSGLAADPSAKPLVAGPPSESPTASPFSGQHYLRPHSAAGQPDSAPFFAAIRQRQSAVRLELSALPRSRCRPDLPLLPSAACGFLVGQQSCGPRKPSLLIRTIGTRLPNAVASWTAFISAAALIQGALDSRFQALQHLIGFAIFLRHGLANRTPAKVLLCLQRRSAVCVTAPRICRSEEQQFHLLRS